MTSTASPIRPMGRLVVASATSCSRRENTPCAELAWSVASPPGMAGVPGFQEIERLAAAHLTDDNAVRAQAERRAHEVAQGDAARLGAQLRDVRRRAGEFACVFEDHDPVCNERGFCEEGVGKGCLAGRGSARDHDVQAVGERLSQGKRDSRRRGAGLDIVVEAERRGRGFADRETGCFGNRRQDAFKALSRARQFGRHDRAQPVAGRARSGGDKADDALAFCCAEMSGRPDEAAPARSIQTEPSGLAMISIVSGASSASRTTGQKAVRSIRLRRHSVSC
jgi:hypothetical protein